VGGQPAAVRRPVVEQVTSPIDVEVGDWVALHWGTVCERLRPQQLAWLRRTTLDQLATFAAG
jgi:hydrogenase maturation factor